MTFNIQFSMCNLIVTRSVAMLPITFLYYLELEGSSLSSII
nr:MAG TPA: hypothetical protein [Caudoviricetes sp.]